jgi:chromosome segregation ATPase
MEYVFSQHDKILFAKEQELKACRTDLERLGDRSRQAEEFVRASQERERQLGENYERELTKYRQKITEFESKLESVYRSSEKEKVSFEKARSNWMMDHSAYEG